MNGLIINVYRNKRIDCTNGGISSKFDTLTLIGKGIEGPFEPTPDSPPVTIAKLAVWPNESPYMYLVPCDENAKPLPGWFMDGGNIGETCDSRFPSTYSG